MNYNNKHSDEELLKGCRAGNRLAQKYLYERYFGKMMGVAMRYAGDDEEATDILNAAFLKVFTSLDKYESQGNLGGWIARIVFNCAIDFVRKQTTYKKTFEYEGDLPVNNSPIQNPALDNLGAEELFGLIQQLPTNLRSVFSLYVIDGYKHQEIADMLGINEGTSKWQLCEARKRLQGMLACKKVRV